MKRRFRKPAFTLAELLIALAILGVIATFTIPKILDSGSDSKFNSIAKEAAGMVSGAFQSYKLNNSAAGSTTFGDFTPYMNYVTVDTTTTVDSHYNSGNDTCSTVGRICLKLHNGSMIRTSGAVSFGDTASTNCIWFQVDPDGVETTGSTTGPGKAVDFKLYITGRLVTKDHMLGSSYNSSGLLGGCGTPPCDPPWFSWSN